MQVWRRVGNACGGGHATEEIINLHRSWFGQQCQKFGTFIIGFCCYGRYLCSIVHCTSFYPLWHVCHWPSSTQMSAHIPCVIRWQAFSPPRSLPVGERADTVVSKTNSSAHFYFYSILVLWAAKTTPSPSHLCHFRGVVDIV